MANIFLENASKTFLNPPKHDIYYEGRESLVFTGFLNLLGLIVPDKVSADELVVYLQFLAHDMKEGVCRFHHSLSFQKKFTGYYKMFGGNFETWMTYFPSFIRAIAPPEFYDEFIELFRSAIYRLPSKTSGEYGYIEIEPDTIDISNKDKAEVLAALYNNAKPIGMGIVQYDPAPMTEEIAQYVLEKLGPHFGYLKGRPIKTSFATDIIYVGNYNHDNNQNGLAQKAISACPDIIKNNGGKMKSMQ